MKQQLLFSLALLLAVSCFAQKQPWLNESLPTEQRMNALINAMTLEEKVSQLMNTSPGIERLQVKPYNWWNECLHGVARNGRATVFPQAIGLGATFDTDLAFRVASAISDEARAKFTISQEMENYAQYAGLTFWTPNINIFRDPRWGRGQETYGEDPFLTARMGVAFVKGLQGDHPRYLKAAACAKHYAVHSGPEALRHEFDAVVSQKDLWETYLPAFEACVKEGKVEAIMGAYNRTNGESCCASPYLLNEVLVEKWGFTGHIVSDCGGVADIYRGHNLCETPEEAAALALKSGLDLNCGQTFNALPKAVEKGLVAEAEIDQALKDLLRTRFKLGLFDSGKDNPYANISPEVVGSDKHVALAREAAAKSMVLVKNDKNVLPLSKNIKTLYVTGPQAANAEVLLGNYFGTTDNTVNFLDGIVGRVSLGTTVNYKYGQMPFEKNVNTIDWVTGEAKRADACIAVMGISGLFEGEEGEAIASTEKGDRKDIRLPQAQIDFVKKLSKNRKNPLILVVTGGSPIALPELYDYVDAILFTWYPGEQGGNALADVLFGDVSPSGKMPFTVPYSIDDLPPYDDYNMQGRTYRYQTKEPQFPFGFGLTYGDIELTNLKLNKKQLKKEGELTIEWSIENKSTQKIEDVLQVYVSSPEAGKGQPLYSLKKLKRVVLEPGSKQTQKLTLTTDDLKQIDNTGNAVLLSGEYTVYISNASPGTRAEALGASILSNSFVIK